MLIQRPLERDAIARTAKIGWQQQLRKRPINHPFVLPGIQPGNSPSWHVWGDWRELFNTAMAFWNCRWKSLDRSTVHKTGILVELYLQDSRDTAKTQTGIWCPCNRDGQSQSIVYILQQSPVFSDAPSTYIGKEYRNLYGYMEQGYLQSTGRIGLRSRSGGTGCNPSRTGMPNCCSPPTAVRLICIISPGKSVPNFRFGDATDRQRIIDDRSYIANRYSTDTVCAWTSQSHLHRHLRSCAVWRRTVPGDGSVNPLSFYYLYNLNQKWVEPTPTPHTIDWDFMFSRRWTSTRILIEIIRWITPPGDLEPAVGAAALDFNK